MRGISTNTRASSGKDNGEIAVFCVGTSHDVVSTTADSATSMPGFLFAGSFADYITAEKRPQFPASMKHAMFCIALIDFDGDQELALKTVQRLGQIFIKKICMIAVGSNLDSPLVLRAIRAGCSEYLTKPLVATELAESLIRFRENMAVSIQAQSSTGRVLAFFGAKGGVGTTTLAVHLAMHLVQQHGSKTLIIDHKHQLGHVALYLGLKDTQYHFDELLRNVDRLDRELFNGYAIHHDSGLVVLASPDISPNYFECKHDEIERVMDFLRREYDYIIIDSSVEYEDTKMSIIDQADEVYLISTPDVASLRDLARLVEHLSLSPSAEGKLSLTINRSTANDSVTAEQIKKALRFPVSNTVPNNYLELLRSINHGTPIPPDKKSDFNASLASWASGILSKDGAEFIKQKEASRFTRRFALWM